MLTDKKNPKPYNFLGPETDRENALYRAENEHIPLVFPVDGNPRHFELQTSSDDLIKKYSELKPHIILYGLIINIFRVQK